MARRCSSGCTAARSALTEARETVDTEIAFPASAARLEATENRVGRRAVVAARRAGALVEALTERELSVLRALHGPLSQRQIGAELYLSLNTVKGYTKNLYRKLGVRDRLMAVQRARAEGLLPARTTEAVDGHDVRVGPAARVAGERYAVVRMGPDRARPHCG